VSAELARFCITNQNNTRCASFCAQYPDSCRKVTEKIESYCSGNSNTAYCKGLCKRFPEKCAAQQPVVAEVDNSMASGEPGV
jgi:hypothetical protein